MNINVENYSGDKMANYKDKIIIDHIEEIKDGGDRLNQDNLMTLCLPHHNQKTNWAKAKRNKNEKK